MADTKIYRGEEAEYAFEALAKQHQHIVLGDSNHFDPAVSHATASILDNLARGGVKHLFLEISSTHQPQINAALRVLQQTPEASPNDRRALIIDALKGKFGGERCGYADEAQFNGIANLIEHADRYGMKVHCADVDSDAHEMVKHFSPVLKQILKEQYKDYRTLSVESASHHIAAPKIAAGEWTQKSVDAALQEFSRFLDHRSIHDGDTAQFIRQHAGDEKAATFYGLGHVAKPEDLDELLPDAVSIVVRHSNTPFCKGTDFSYLLDKHAFTHNAHFEHSSCTDLSESFPTKSASYISNQPRFHR